MRTITSEDIESRKLTEGEIGWLLQRERFADIARNGKLFPDKATKTVEPAKKDDEGEGVDPSTLPDEYESWKIKELREEGEAREPAVDFTGCTLKSEFIDALREWDKAHPDEDDEEEDDDKE